jgi:hypothetical protein
MKVQLLHGIGGEICAIYAPAEGARQGGIKSPTPDRFVIELDVPELRASDAEADIAAMLVHLTDNFVVEAGRLIERSTRDRA